jgi:uncharacterized protein YfdQ (DUF2303 family)
MSTTEHSVKEIAELADKGATRKIFYVRPRSQQVVTPSAEAGKSHVLTVDTERDALVPSVRRGNTTFHEVASFLRYIIANHSAGDGTVYVDARDVTPTLVAVLNDHGPNGPGFRDFRASLSFVATKSWKAWNQVDNNLLDQHDFAEFIEENVRDIVDHPGSDMLDIVTKLEASQTLAFKSGIRLQSGHVRLKFEENGTAKVGRNDIDVPATLTLRVRPFIGSRAYDVVARFRWRIQGGTLKLGFLLQRTEDLMEQIIKDTIEVLEKALPENVSIAVGVAPDALR